MAEQSKTKRWSNTVVTDSGNDLLTEFAAGKILKITGAYGSGGMHSEDLTELSELPDGREHPLTIESVVKTDNSVSVCIQVTSIGNPEPYKMERIGIYAIARDPGEPDDSEERIWDDKLLMVIEDAEDENGSKGVTIPAESDQLYTFKLYAVLSITNKERLEVSVSSVGIATIGAIQDAMDQHNADPDAHAGMMQGEMNAHNEDPTAHRGLLARTRGLELAMNGSETITEDRDPTTETEGKKGQHYINTDTGEEFICTGDQDGKYIWEKVDDSGGEEKIIIKAIQDAVTAHNNDRNAHSDLTARARGLELALNGSETMTGDSAPTTETKGKKDQRYINTETGDEFVCTDDQDGKYTWEKVDDSNRKSLLEVLEEAKQELSEALEATKDELASSAGGFAARITFQEGSVGWNYRITDGADETYTGIVPESLVVEVVLRKCSTVYTVTAWPDGEEQDGWSNQVTTGEYFGSIESEVTDFDATLTVTTLPNAIVTAVCGEQSYTAVAGDDGITELKIGVAGRYEVTAALDGKTVSGYVTVSESQSYALFLLDFRVDINAKPMARGYIAFEPEDWGENELRISQEVHGLEPVSDNCVCSVRMLVGRNVRELTEEDVAGIGQAIIDAVTEAKDANGAAEEAHKPYPPAEDDHIPLTWEQIQYILLEGELILAAEAEGQADELGFGLWKDRGNGVESSTTLDELLQAAYLALLADGKGALRTQFDSLCTLEVFQGLRFRVEASGPRYIKIDGHGYAAKYDMDGTMRRTWGTVSAESNAYMDLETKELVIPYKTPFPGDVLVIG